MGFQPFGYRFEVISHLSLADAKQAIRAKKTGIFDAKNGARGWVAGPFICLWFSAFDRYGPMLFGVISSDNVGTQVRGRAGSDLNGVLMFTLLMPVMAWLVFMMISERQASVEQLLVIGSIFLIGGPLVYWSAHKERKDAEPLVRFLRKTLSTAPVSPRAAHSESALTRDTRLILKGVYLEGQVTPDAVKNALMRVGNGDFLIIKTAEQDYVQTASQQNAFVLEMRKGGPAEHYKAVRTEKSSNLNAKGMNHFTFDEIEVALVAYVSGLDIPPFMRWQPMG